MNDTLYLPLKARYYDMIESGEKPEEYRVTKPYWIKRFCDLYKKGWCDKDRATTNCLGCMREMDWYTKFNIFQYKYVCFSYGYTKRRMTWEVESIRIGYGNPAWGAPLGEIFIIKLGRRIDNE